MAVRAEESGTADPELRVTGWIQNVAEDALHAQSGRLVEVQISAGLLIRSKRIIERANRVRRICDL